MAGLTKTQINYLRDKLDRVVNEKINNYKKELGEDLRRGEYILNSIKSGKIKLLTSKQILAMMESKIKEYYYSYSPSFSIEEFIDKEDKERIEKEINDRQDKLNDYSEKLRRVQTDALDKIVLEGVDFETAIQELNNVQ